jgi:hypothetical protein
MGFMERPNEKSKSAFESPWVDEMRAEFKRVRTQEERDAVFVRYLGDPDLPAEEVRIYVRARQRLRLIGKARAATEEAIWPSRWRRAARAREEAIWRSRWRQAARSDHLLPPEGLEARLGRGQREEGDPRPAGLFDAAPEEQREELAHRGVSAASRRGAGNQPPDGASERPNEKSKSAFESPWVDEMRAEFKRARTQEERDAVFVRYLGDPDLPAEEVRIYVRARQRLQSIGDARAEAVLRSDEREAAQWRRF